MGNLMALAEVVQQSVPHLQLLVVAGRNEALRQRMLERTWQGAVHIYGFVRNMPQLMRAADVIITKAGPSTLSEALVCGLPIVISGYVPGQEEGNVRYIVNHQAGYFLSNLATELGALLASRFADDGEGMAATTLNASALGRPDAAREAARLVLGLCPKIDAGGD
ncbi:MAG: glycosyltransferase [Chloroflexi bacterium]|nr:glycosyltransferase [Chloroflexota bacterium]